MNISDTFYVALCMTILILGVVYWFWTQSQYMQRKLNLLENIVFEMKTNMNSSSVGPPDGMGGGGAGAGAGAGSAGGGGGLILADYPPAPSSEFGDDDDLLHSELQHEMDESSSMAMAMEDSSSADIVGDSSSAAAPANVMAPVPEEHEDDLQPGGVGSGIGDFSAPDVSAKASVLKTMTLKELQRLAVQKGISGTSGMRKDALIDALRNAAAASPPSIKPFDASETLNLS